MYVQYLRYHINHDYRLILVERRHIEMGELKVRWQGCQHGGCHYELAIQLIITMVGKQAFNNIKELVLIKSRQFSRSVQWRRKTKLKQWEMDYKLDFDHTLYDGKFV